jgi:hypothetical protein
VNTGNLDVKMNYIPRLLDQLEIFVTDKELKDKPAIQVVRKNLIHAFNEVSRYFATNPDEKAIRKIVELFGQNALVLDESWNTDRAIFGTQVALEIYSLVDARKKYKEAIGQYGLFLNGQKEGYVNAVALSDDAIYNITKICMNNNLVSTADGWTFPNLKEESK